MKSKWKRKPEKHIYTAVTYDEVYLQSKHWQKIKNGLYKKIKACQLCFKTDRQLNIHHITYARLGHEDLRDLIVLCEYCHLEVVHKGLVSKRELFAITGGAEVYHGFTMVANRGGKPAQIQEKKPPRPKRKRQPISQKQIDGRLLKKMGAIAFYQMKRQRSI